LTTTYLHLKTSLYITARPFVLHVGRLTLSVRFIATHTKVVAQILTRTYTFALPVVFKATVFNLSSYKRG